MIVAGIGWITDQSYGSLRRGLKNKFEDPKSLYQQLEAEGFFTLPPSKVRWLNTVSQRYCLAGALALRDVFEDPDSIRLTLLEAGVLGLSRDGALQPNLEYFKDYVQSGRKLARGNLFIHTLPTSPLAEVAITFGFKGPIFHLSAANPKLNLLFDRSEALGQKSEGLNILCCVASDHAVICIFLKSDYSETDSKLFSLEEMRARIGNLWDLKEVFRALNIETQIIKS